MEYERRRQRVSHFDNEPPSRSRSCGAYRPLKFLRTNADTELIPFLLTGRFNKHPSVRLYRVPFQYGLAPVSFFQRASGVRLAPFLFFVLSLYLSLSSSLCLSIRERSLWRTTRHREIHRARWTVKTTRLAGGMLACRAITSFKMISVDRLMDERP